MSQKTRRRQPPRARSGKQASRARRARQTRPSPARYELDRPFARFAELVREATGVERFVAVVALLLPLVFLPFTYAITFTEKATVVLVAGAVGVVELLRVAARSEHQSAARAALVFLVIGLLSAALSAVPAVGFFGLYQWGTGWLFLVASMGMWALGLQVRAAGRELLRHALVLATLVNVVIGIVQVTANVAVNGLNDANNAHQAYGLMGNPVFLEGLLLGVLALVLRPAIERPWPYLLVVAAIAFGLELSSERAAVVLLAVALVVALVLWRSRALGPVAAVVMGFVAGLPVGGRTLAARSNPSAATGNIRHRIDVWLAGAHALLRHPLIGAGPGEYGGATTPFYTLAITRTGSPSVLLTDAHNLFVEYTVTTGILGILAFFTWMFLSGRRARGPYLGFALLVLALEMLEPQNVGLTPLAFLAFGVASATPAGAPSPATAGLRKAWSTVAAPVTRLGQRVFGPLAARMDRPVEPLARALAPGSRWRAALVSSLATLAFAAGMTTVVGDAELYNAKVDGQLGAGKVAHELIGFWPDAATAIAAIYSEQVAVRSHGTMASREALHWYHVAAETYPPDPGGWTQYGYYAFTAGEFGVARAADLRSLRDDPWWVAGLSGLGELAMWQHDWAPAVHWLTLAAQAAPGIPVFAKLAAAARAHVDVLPPDTVARGVE
jgi:hypothetical protein